MTDVLPGAMWLRGRGGLGWLVVAGATAALAAGPALAQTAPPFVGVNAGAPISGESILFTDALAADIASSGCRFVRINFIAGAAGWNATRLGKYDTIIQTARNRNLEVLALFSNETENGSQAQWNQNYNTTGLNPYISAYAQTAFMLINRYKADLQLYEIWNEPSCWSVPPSSNPLNPGCTYLWPKIFGNLLAETYKTCIANGGPTFFSDHGISFVSGAPFAHDIGGSFTTGADYMSDVYAQSSVWNAFQSSPNNPTGRRYPWDFFGYHFYLNQGSAVSVPELSSYFSTIRSTKAANNDHTEIIVTEFGWTTDGVGDQLQAQNLTDTYDFLKTQSDVAAGMWYQWNCCDPNGDWGLTRGIGNHKPSYFALADQCDTVTADFSANPRSGVAPLAVQFTSLSTGDITSYMWDFGDSTGSGQEHPLHTYLLPGTYTVSLTVHGTGDPDTATKVGYIEVSGTPADLDGDLDVDLDDHGLFQLCYSGSGLVQDDAACAGAKLDSDNDVDEQDLALFMGCVSGANVPADAGCLD